MNYVKYDKILIEKMEEVAKHRINVSFPLNILANKVSKRRDHEEFHMTYMF